MNDRPLTTTTPNDLRDRTAITPNLLIFGRHLSPMPYGESALLEDPDDLAYEPNEEQIKRQWRRMATRLNRYRQQFQEEYLSYLRERHRIQHHDDPHEEIQIHVGDLVIMKNDIEKRCLWELAEVIEILPSADNRTRAVRLRTKNGETTRPIVKLCPLLSSSELRPEQEITQEQTQEREDDGTTQEGNDSTPDPDGPSGTTADSTSTPEPAPRSRPQRAAKTAGREKVQQWTKDLRDN